MKMLLLLFCFFFYYDLFAQADFINFQKFSVDEGLSENLVRCFYQDSKGFLWIGTDDGLNKFDGYSFRIYRYEPGNPNSLSDYAINAINEDKTGILWIATREGLNRFDPSTETFKVYRHDPDDKNSLCNNFIYSLFADSRNNLWIGTRNGLNLLDLKSQKFTLYKNDPADSNSISHNVITSIEESSDGKIWVGTTNGLNEFDFKSGHFRSYKHDPNDKNSIIGNSVYTVRKDLNEKLWVGTGSGLSVLDLKKKKFTGFVNSDNPNTLSNNSVRSICVDNLNNIWIATLGGLNKLDPSRKKNTRYNYDEKNSASISSDVCRSVFADNSGVIWIGTDGRGLNKLSPRSQKFIHIRHEEKNPHSLNSDHVQCFYEDKDGILWLGLTGGINKISSASLTNGSYEFDFIKFPSGKSGSLSESIVTSILDDNSGVLWIGTFGGGLVKHNKLGNSFEQFLPEPGNENSLTHERIHSLYRDKQGIIWIGTGLGGLVRFDPEKKLFKAYKPDAGNSLSISSVEVTSIAEDEEGILWLGTTTGGLNKFNKKEEKFYHYRPDPENVNTLSSTRVNTLYLDKKNILWIGTFGGGLNRFDKAGNSFSYYTVNNGLPSNIIMGIVEDKKGNLWISTTNGLSKFNPAEKSFKNYNVFDGLQGNEFADNSCFVSPATGYIFFGGGNGFNYFHPDKIREDNYIPSMVITDFKIFNRNVPINLTGNENISPLTKSITYSDEISLSYNQNVFSFEFASLHFANSVKNRYAYKMEGFDEDWVNSGSRNSASYTNLDPGTYIFKVKGTNSDGIWNGKEASLKINITPPWWHTWWAYMVYVLIFITILFSARRYEMNRIKLKNNLKLKEFETEKLNEVDKMKSRFFANISHEFRTPLALILGILDKYLKRAADPSDFKVMKKNAQRLLQLINQLLELSKIESGSAKLQMQKTDLYGFVRRIASSFISLADRQNIELLFNGLPLTVPNENHQLLVFADRDKMETVIYNLLSNALKFTPRNKKVFIDISNDDKYAEIKITNTGVGIPPEKLPFIFNRFYQADESETRGYEGTGIGLALVKELIELHHGEVKVESTIDVETSFKVILPLGQKHFTPDQIIEIPQNQIVIEAAEPIEEILIQVEPLTIKEEIKRSPDSKESNEKFIQKSQAGIVLVVEDHFDLRNFICEQLEDDFTVVEAEDGEKGVMLAEELIPDLVLSDIMMPKMNGYELCKELKTNIKTNHIPVILLTAKASFENKMEGLELGADDYLIKPFNTDELKTRVRNLIKIRQQMREKFRSEMLIKPSEVIVPSNQKVFIEKLTGIIERHIENENFSIEILCKEIGMSRAQLHRKIKAVTNQSATEFIRTFRLQRAADLIKQDAGNMAEIAYKVGFNSQAYFTKSFQDVYGCSPGEFKKKYSRIHKETG